MTITDQFLERDSQRWLPARMSGGDGEAIPPFAVLEINGTELPGGLSREAHSILNVRKPVAYIHSQPICINGPKRMVAPNGIYGRVTQDFPTYALYDSADGTPVAGEVWGPEIGSYKLHKGATGFTIMGGVKTLASGEHIVRVERSPPPAHPYAAAFRVSMNAVAANGGIVYPMADLYRDPDNNLLSTGGVYFGTYGLHFTVSGSYLVGFSTSLFSSAARGALLAVGLYLGESDEDYDDHEATQYTAVRTQDIEVDQYGTNLLTTIENVANSGPLQIRAGQVLTLRNASNVAIYATPVTLFAVLLFPHTVAASDASDDADDEPANEVQQILAASNTGSAYNVTFGGQTTGLIACNASAATVQAALEALSTIGSGNVSVTLTLSGAAGTPQAWEVEFVGDLAAQDVALMTTGIIGISISVVTEGG